jgi:hypothetical protein
MKKQKTIQEKVIEILIKWGNNIEEAKKIASAKNEWAYTRKSPAKIAEAIIMTYGRNGVER